MAENGKFYRVGIADSGKVDFNGQKVIPTEPLKLNDKKGKNIGMAQIIEGELVVTAKHDVIFNPGQPRVVESSDEFYALWVGQVKDTQELELRYNGINGETVFRFERMDED